MFCDNCGEELDSSDRYCPNCGEQVRDARNEQSGSDRTQDAEEKTASESSDILVRWSLVALVALVTGVVCLSFVFSIDSDEIPVGSEIIGPTSPLDPDTDNDGLKDGVELRSYSTDPLDSDTDDDGLKDGREFNELGTDPTSADTDGDGLPDEAEAEDLDTSPTESDTDDDGLNDSEEINGDTDANNSDTDNDGLEDGREINLGTNPLVKDSDGDRLEDGVEVNKYGSDPLVVDTDSDGLDDGQEATSLNTSPTSADTDSDGLDDNEEISEYNTEPTVSDTDNDSLEDGREIELGTSPVNRDSDSDDLVDGQEVDIGSDPLVADSDSDGLDDGVEVSKYDTSPTSSDSDSDGLDDAREVRLGTEPNNADTDSDRLQDGREIKIGTSPDDPDTDGDGLPDGFEDDNGTNFQSDLDPMHKDILVEVDTDTSTDIPREIGLVVNEFSNAPVSNPDNEQGINLRVYYNDETSINVKDSQSINYYADNAYQSEFDLKGYGFYHALIVDDVIGERVGGVTSPSIDGMLIQDSNDNDRISRRFAHELGHQLGLLPSDFDGIDSTEYTFDSYPSAMNYVCRNQNKLFQRTDCGVVQYSTGTGFDDWSHIEDSLPSTAPSTDKIE